MCGQQAHTAWCLVTFGYIRTTLEGVKLLVAADGTINFNEHSLSSYLALQSLVVYLHICIYFFFFIFYHLLVFYFYSDQEGT